MAKEKRMNSRYEEQWTEHIEGVKRLKWNLTKEDRERVDEIVEELHDLKEKAVEQEARGDA